MEERYIKIKKRLGNFCDIKNMSDKEIIEVLDREIEQYRERIENQKRIIDELSKREIKSEEMILDETGEVLDEDIAEIETNTIYANGKPVEIITKYKYKQA